MHLGMKDNQNGQKMMVLPSADKTRLTHFILSKNIFSSKRSSLAADGDFIMSLPWYPRKIVHFSLLLSPSRPKMSMVESDTLESPFKAISFPTALQKPKNLRRFNNVIFFWVTCENSLAFKDSCARF
jgi:hypothetical protein